MAKVDWAWRAVTETARVTKQLIRLFYSRAPERSYFAGCSTGGRMAAIEAQRFPDDFDGIISGAPSLDETALSAIWSAWVVKANTGKDGKEILNRAKVSLVRGAVLKACANADGVVEDRRGCAFQPKQLECPRRDGADCVTAAEVGVLERWYAPPRNSKGDILAPAVVPLGSEPF